MRITSEEFDRFYATPLGQVAEDVLRRKLSDAWGTCKGLRVAGFGYPHPLMPAFSEADHHVTMVPAAAGAVAARDEVLVEEGRWPLREASVDRLVIMHGLEETPDPSALLREAWRVLTDDGRLIIVAANRHGFWTLFENSPLAAGRAYSRGQLLRALGGAMFAPTAQAAALYFPPIRQLRRLATLWEQTAERLEPLSIPLPSVAGVELVEARRSMAAPASGTKSEALSGIFAAGGRRVVGLAAERGGQKTTARGQWRAVR
ncbi:MAG: methyltransferase domain-containing protein [Pseudomonadota bacterium]